MRERGVERARAALASRRARRPRRGAKVHAATSFSSLSHQVLSLLALQNDQMSVTTCG